MSHHLPDLLLAGLRVLPVLFVEIERFHALILRLFVVESFNNDKVGTVMNQPPFECDQLLWYSQVFIDTFLTRIAGQVKLLSFISLFFTIAHLDQS